MRPTRAIVNLSKLDENINQLRKVIKADARFMAIIKANAYGHGAIQVARQALDSGASWLGVAIPEEGAELRESGISAPILVLGGIDESQIKTVVEYDLSQCVFSLDTANLLEQEGKRLGKQVGVHIKIDTGMRRIGLVGLKEISEFCQQLKNKSHLRLEGIFTHFAAADEEDKSFTHEQSEQFSKALNMLYNIGIQFDCIHAANSAAIIDYPDTHFNLVRGGIAMYGYYPSREVKQSMVQLEPILRLETKVVHVKCIERGDSISYGRTFVAKEPMRIATLPIGYADGYSRKLSNKGWVLIDGQRANIVGTVCMDQIMVDVTHIPRVKIGDTAVLIGQQGSETVSADVLAHLAGTISYEILTGIASRVPRIYISHQTI
jgi:alanine racemase